MFYRIAIETHPAIYLYPACLDSAVSGLDTLDEARPAGRTSTLKYGY